MPQLVVSLAVLLSMHSPNVTARVDLALQNPTAYLAQYKDNAESRGISDPIPELPWFALIDGLIVESKACEIDWKEDPADLILALNKILKAKAINVEIPKKLALYDAPTSDTIKHIGTWLSERGLVLACIWIDSDSYVLTIVDFKIWISIAQITKPERSYGEVYAFREDMREEP